MSDNEYQPLKGDPSVLRSKAQHYANIADAITRSVTTLNAIHKQDDMTSKATDALKDKAGSVADDIDKARDRYAVTAQALITYSVKLREAQDAANLAITHINDKQSEADTAHRTAATAKQDATDATPDDATTKQAAASKADDTATNANTALAAAHKEWHDALDIKNAAADVAVKAIVEVVDGKGNHGLKDSWWDNWGSKLYDAFKTICKWAGVLSIFLSWVPILGQVLLVLAAIGAVIDLIESVVNAITKGGSWLTVLVALGGVALTFVGGAAFKSLATDLKSVAAIRTLPKALKGVRAGETATMTGMRSILKVKNGESMVPTMLAARKVTQTSLKDTAKDIFKTAAKDKLPNADDLIPKFKNLKELFAVNGDLVQAAKLVKLNPSLLRDPAFALKFGGASAYQIDKSYEAYNKLNDPKSYVKWNDTLSGAVLGG